MLSRNSTVFLLEIWWPLRIGDVGTWTHHQGIYDLTETRWDSPSLVKHPSDPRSMKPVPLYTQNFGYFFYTNTHSYHQRPLHRDCMALMWLHFSVICSWLHDCSWMTPSIQVMDLAEWSHWCHRWPSMQLVCPFVRSVYGKYIPSVTLWLLIWKWCCDTYLWLQCTTLVTPMS